MVCRIKNWHTFKSLLICNSSYHDSVWYAELRIGILLKVCRFVIRHITQIESETETEANFTQDSEIFTQSHSLARFSIEQIFFTFVRLFRNNRADPNAKSNSGSATELS